MKRIEIHPVNPQPRLIRQVAEQFQTGALVALPTDASYVLACHLEDRTAVDRMRQLRGIDEKHLLTLLCRDLSELSQYAQVDNRQFRFLKEWTPGAYTFILPATREVPRRLMHPSRKTAGPPGARSGRWASGSPASRRTPSTSTASAPTRR